MQLKAMEIVFVSELKVVMRGQPYLRLWTSGQGAGNQRIVGTVIIAFVDSNNMGIAARIMHMGVRDRDIDWSGEWRPFWNFKSQQWLLKNRQTIQCWWHCSYCIPWPWKHGYKHGLWHACTVIGQCHHGMTSHLICMSLTTNHKKLLETNLRCVYVLHWTN